MAGIRIGISGWRYAPWRGGAFYPAGLPQRAELEYAARRFSVIEINGSFYSLQRPECYARWYAHTPAGFEFTVKGPRFITHMLRLREPRQALANFFASGLFHLREKLGPILWQLPPTMRFDPERLTRFLELLPQDLGAARALARCRAAWMKGRVRLATVDDRPLRYALEVRHPSFIDPGFIELLRARSVALVVAETAGHFPLLHDVTAGFVYVRLHGDRELYRSGYGPRALERWARRIRAWHAGGEPDDAPTVAAPSAPSAPRDVYCLFDNTDAKLRAPHDAQSLMRRLGLARVPGPGFARPSGGWSAVETLHEAP